MYTLLASTLLIKGVPDANISTRDNIQLRHFFQIIIGVNVLM